MRKFYWILTFCIGLCVEGQIAHYNQYPTMYVEEEINITGASFAYSMRKLNNSYTGPLVKLRRDSDNATQNFYANSSTQKLDVSAVNTWGGSNTLYVEVWYDQSNSNRNATQTNTAQQPELILTNSAMPEIKFDGSNDYLRVNNGNLQNVTNAGKQGSLFTIARSSKRNQTNFGVLSGHDRWSGHLNWSDNMAYFDLGSCCYTLRSFDNSSNENAIAQYTAVVGDGTLLVKNNLVEKINGAIPSVSCTKTYDFLIGAASTGGSNVGGNAKTSFVEFILYPTDISSQQYLLIESNEVTFWGL